MSEFRQNPITKKWVLISPNRNKRPDDYKTVSVMKHEHEESSSCVFCPEKEQLNQSLNKFFLQDLEKDFKDLYPYKNLDAKDWEVRVIKNKYPSLDKNPIFAQDSFYHSRSAEGVHEVVVTKIHNAPVALQSTKIIDLSLLTFIYRSQKIAQDKTVKYIQIFHNHGKDAGASIVHPHYQIMSLPFVPSHVYDELLGSHHYAQEKQVCAYCDIIRIEEKEKYRLIYANDSFVVISAYASRSPFETWILPRKHTGRFENITPEERENLSYVLKMVLEKLYTKLSDPPLNFYIHTMPTFDEENQRLRQLEKDFHWHLTIFPRLTMWAGFEYATDIPVNPIPPETTADFLRN